MRKSEIEIDGIRFPLYSLNTLVVGSGAAGLNAAVSLDDFGQRDIAIVTSRWGGGTSANAGSDKQTYYKLSIAGDKPDSPYEMARDLAAGGCMHGDIAMCEALNSLRSFFHLVQLGVPFPYGRFGGYVGYKTDHDPRQRATSAGPYTSRYMFECLAAEVKRKGIQVLDGHELIGLLAKESPSGKKVTGAIALDLRNPESPHLGFVLFNAVNVVLATGGPAGIYKNSVYPEDQTGSHGIALEIGAAGQNLTESQFGIASLKFRWNLSGSYQQVIPRYISTEPDGGDEREFLNEVFPDMGSLATAIFLKGYQWPFDPLKIAGFGSSLIDVLVYEETVNRGRRVFLDFTRNPSGGGSIEDFSLRLLGPEAYTYLEKSGALLRTPIERLTKMNPAAVRVYAEHGIDLSRERLEIGLCSQHNNGGLKGNIWWESNIRHLFPVGEVNGSHGVRRPGGSALNSGQVGSLRAAQFISRRYDAEPPGKRDFLDSAVSQINSRFETAKSMIDRTPTNNEWIRRGREEIRERMTACGAAVRGLVAARKAVEDAWGLLGRLGREIKAGSPRDLPDAFKTLDLCLTHAVYLEAVREYLERGGRSRGSYLVLDAAGVKPCAGLPDTWRFSLTPPDAEVNRKILEISLDPARNIRKTWVDVRPIPLDEAWFETVWNNFVKDEIIREEE